MKDHTPKTTTILCPDDFSGGRARFAMVFRLPSLYCDKYGRQVRPRNLRRSVDNLFLFGATHNKNRTGSLYGNLTLASLGFTFTGVRRNLYTKCVSRHCRRSSVSLNVWSMPCGSNRKEKTNNRKAWTYTTSKWQPPFPSKL